MMQQQAPYAGVRRHPSTPHATRLGAMVSKPQSPEAMMEYDIRQLFERHTIEEIRLREHATREDIEGKSQELRKLVGTRYRDLIDSADSVIAMKDASLEMCRKLEQIEAGCHSLLSTARKDEDNSAAVSRSSENDSNSFRRSKMYHLARQIKLLVDAPEQIWSMMEKQEHLAATRLYIDAEKVHSSLTTDRESSNLVRSIPLVVRQWSLISQFPYEIKHNSRAILRTPGLSSQIYAGALCSLVLLDRLSPLDAFKQFLSSQREYVLSVLSSPSSSSNPAAEDTLSSSPVGPPSAALPLTGDVDADAAIQKLSKLIGTIQYALFQMGAIFSPRFATQCYGASMPLLWGMLFSSNTLSAAAPPSYDKSKLSDEVIQKACKDWLQQCCDGVKPTISKLLASVAKKAAHLMIIKQHLSAAIEAAPFPPVLQPNSHPTHTTHANNNTNTNTPTAGNAAYRSMSAGANRATISNPSPMGTPKSSPLLSILDFYTASQFSSATPPILIWHNICKWVIGWEADLWSFVFGEVYADTAKLITRTAFSSLNMSLLHKHTNTIQGRESMGTYIWNQSDREDKSDTLDAIKLEASGMNQPIQEIVHDLDAQLEHAMTDLHHLLIPPAPPAPPVITQLNNAPHKSLTRTSSAVSGFTSTSAAATPLLGLVSSYSHPNTMSRTASRVPSEIGIMQQAFADEDSDDDFSSDDDENSEKDGSTSLSSLTSLDSMSDDLDSVLLSRQGLFRRSSEGQIASYSSLLEADATLRAYEKRRTKTRNAEDRQVRRQLKVYLQDTCFQSLFALLSSLNDVLTQLEAEGHAEGDTQSSVSLDRALFIGKVCRAIGEHTQQLSLIFHPRPPAPAVGATPGTPGAALKRKLRGSQRKSSVFSRSGRPLARSSGVPLGRSTGGSIVDMNSTILVPHPQLTEILGYLRSLYLRVSMRWARVSGAAIAAELRQKICSDDWSDSEKKRMWQPMSVAIESPLDALSSAASNSASSASATSTREETIYLPWQPSSYVLSFLFSVCQDINRVSAHTPEKIIIEYLVRVLISGVVDAYTHLLVIRPVEQMCKEAVIQMAFDTKLLFDMLRSSNSAPEASEGELDAALHTLDRLNNNPQNSNNTNHDNNNASKLNQSSEKDPTPSSKTLRSRTEKLSDDIQNLLDPIDRAFYGPHLAVYIEQCYHRCSSLLGFLRTLHPSAPIKFRNMRNEHHNALPLLAPCARFRYLPISNPSLTPTTPPTTPVMTPASPAVIHTEISAPTYHQPQGTGVSGYGIRQLGTNMFELGRRFGLSTNTNTTPDTSI
eukprot:TRINITY_DN5895_c0_g1_i2.p1 TRINITY_DN5895_c0_g1~~TRINITY_DN5895_c0_g1_i2.p1  ORF type:complete len:1290 (-),score=232.30 TRINITY_DN5895_c0_g1_i2:130-3999(-)